MKKIQKIRRKEKRKRNIINIKKNLLYPKVIKRLFNNNRSFMKNTKSFNNIKIKTV
jgi:hypothetical protein